jgi:hypothetical protein
MSIGMGVQDFGKCAKLFFSFSTQSFSLLPVSAVLKNVPLCAKRASKFYL